MKETACICLCAQKSAVNGNVSFSELATYPYEILCRKAELPDGIDPSHKEVGLLVGFHVSFQSSSLATMLSRSTLILEFFSKTLKC